MRTEEVIDHELMRIWKTMLECMYIGCHLKDSPRRTQCVDAYGMHQI
jgi:hypothetical protein